MPEDTKRVRDLQGRWLKGVSGNPKGRPDKYAKVDFGDLSMFRYTVREVTTPEGKVMMTREAAVQHRLYQSAMQGNVYAQIFLTRRFEQFDKDSSEIEARFNRLVMELNETGRDPTPQEEFYIAGAMKLLRIRLPGSKEPQEPVRKRPSRRKTNKSESGSGNGGNTDPHS